jgi:AcrR family transcriptional regulator
MSDRRRGRRQAVGDLKRSLILAAARGVFEAEGLDGASLRAIAAAAGYTPAALYFHFDSKEAIYAEVLRASLSRLGEAVAGAMAATRTPDRRLQAAAMAFFGFYAENPGDLDLGFYLLRGGMKPRGLGRARDEALNAALAAALHPIAAAAVELGASPAAARMLMVDCFAHAAGLLLLAHTGRIRMFGASAEGLMHAYVEDRIARLGARPEVKTAARRAPNREETPRRERR